MGICVCTTQPAPVVPSAIDGARCGSENGRVVSPYLFVPSNGGGFVKDTWRGLLMALIVAGLSLTRFRASGEDWPAYRKDAARSAVTTSQLDFPLGTAWVHRLSQPPRPAWPDCGRAFSIFDFDYAAMPVVAEGIVYLSSSADDTVYALDAADGSERWRYTAGGPVRFAPHIAQGRCYFSSDDGWIYCLDARTGEELWTRRLGGDDRMFLGNGRLISRWPSRSGVLVDGDTLYVVGGMWPSEGVAVYALDAKTGQVRWCNDTINAFYLPYPHDGLSLGGPTSQGYLLSEGTTLAMPTGEGSPALFDAVTGEFLHWDARPAGSTWGTLVDGFVATPARGWQPNLPVRLGETGLFRADGLAFFPLEGGRADYGRWNSYDRLPGSPREGLDRWRGQIAPIGGRNRAVFTGERFFASGSGELEALDASGDALERLWAIRHERIYSLALAGETLLAGSDGRVSAVDSRTGQILWQGRVDGQARGLAVAGGTLYVSTEQGTLFAFAPGHETTEEEPGTAVSKPLPPGYALVVGSDDTAVGERLAETGQWHVLVLLSDARAVREARTRLVSQGVYGRSIVVHPTSADGTLPYGDYFVDEVRVVGAASGICPSEIYRVLRPISGRIEFAELTGEERRAFVRRAGIAEQEFDGRVVTRGRLEGAFDWDSPAGVDQRVSWPLELLWFGSPGRQRILSRHRADLPPPVPAAGRVFHLGDGYVMAVDAYNGRELWSRYAPGYRHVAADDRHAYLGIGGAMMQLDAQTGRLQRIFGQVEPQVFSLDRPQTFSAESEDGRYGGTIGVRRTNSAVELHLTSQTPGQDDKDGWVMWFDFRPVEQRLLPSGPGAFPLIVDLKRGRLRRFTGFAAAPLPAVDLQATEDGYRLRIPLTELRRLTDHDPDSFDMVAELELYLQGDQRRMFHAAPLTQRRDAWRAGSATFVLRGPAGPSQAPLAAVDRAPRDQLPAHARNWGRVPQYERHDGNIPRLPVIPEGREELALRTNPFTGEQGERFFLRGYGCSGTVASATMNLVRSGTIGMYDLADDSGMRNLPGTRSGCRITLSPALGLLLSLEGTGDCFCPYNFPATVALSPARQRSHEDWAVFMDQARLGPMRQLALNFGAPGDRRDEQGQLWLGYPRAAMMYATGQSFGPFPQTISLPVSFDMAPHGGPYRRNANRVELENTNRPWITASGLEGVRGLQLSLIYHEPLTTVLASPVSVPPQIDGRLGATWSGDPGLPVAGNPGGLSDEGRVRVRYDQDNLYVGFARQALLDRRGNPQPWDPDTRFHILFKDTERAAYAQFQVGLDGTLRSQAVSSVVPLPRLSRADRDGTADDWRDRGVTLELGESRGSLRMAWSDQGILLDLRVPESAPDDFPRALRAQFANLEQERILELVVDTQERTAHVVRGKVLGPDGREREPTVFDELATTRMRRDLNQLRASETVEAEVQLYADQGYLVVEALLPVEALEPDTLAEPSLGFQLSAFDPEHPDGNLTSGSGARRDLLDSGSLLTVVPGEATSGPRRVTTADLRREWYGHVWNFQATRHEVPTGRWAGAARAEDGEFQVEMAIPRSLLEAVDLSLDRLLAQWGAAGDLTSNLAELDRRFRSRFVRIHTEPVPAEPASYRVRLHFAELEDLQPGQRVFDVHLQGRPVLESFDVVREAGGPRRAIRRDFRVSADQELRIEFVPRTGEPVISGLELLQSPH